MDVLYTELRKQLHRTSHSECAVDPTKNQFVRLNPLLRDVVGAVPYGFKLKFVVTANSQFIETKRLTMR